MKVTVRGWGRDMGEKVIASYYLPDVEYRSNGTAYRAKPVLYEGPGNITVAWCQPLKLTGDYRMEVQLTPFDVMWLYKCLFGSELKLKHVERYGLTFSPDVVKSILKTVKLSDLTLGELVAMSATSQTEEAAATETVAAPTNVTPMLRRKL